MSTNILQFIEMSLCQECLDCLEKFEQRIEMQFKNNIPSSIISNPPQVNFALPNRISSQSEYLHRYRF